MITLVQQLSEKLADRWATMLVGPGLLFVTCVAVAAHQGFAHALDLSFLRHYIQGTIAAKHDAGTIAVAAALGTIAAVVAGLIAAGAGQIIEQVWMPTAPAWYVDLLTRRRQRRWDRAESRLTAEVTTAAQQIAREQILDMTSANRHPRVRRLRASRDRICKHRPEMPTWPAERMQDLTRQIRARHDLDLAVIWPYIWNVSTGPVRGDLSTAQDGYAAAARLTAWGLLYLLIVPALWWWPAIPLAAVLIVAGWHRSRTSIDVLADLVGSAVDLNIREVAEKTGATLKDPPIAPNSTLGGGQATSHAS